MEDAEQLRQMGAKRDYVAFEHEATNMLAKDSKHISIHTGWPGAECIADSLKRIMVHAKGRSAKTLS